MSKTKDDTLNNAMHLSTAERAELAAALLASLDGEPEHAVEAAWAA
jgi:Putative addiction module component